MDPFDCHSCQGQIDDHEDDCPYFRPSPEHLAWLAKMRALREDQAKPWAHPDTMIGKQNR